jgi:hypothetical protein
MTWVAVGVGSGAAVGGIAGGYLGSQGAKSAAQTQADAIRYAADIQNQMFNKATALEQPYVDFGQTGVSQLNQQLPYLTSQFTTQDFYNNIDPGYQFRLSQGQRQAAQSANQGGGYIGGNALTALNNYTQGAASQEYGNAFNRQLAQKQNIYSSLYNIASMGQNAASKTGTMAMQYGQNAGQLATAGGAANAAGIMGSTNAITGGINQAVGGLTNAGLYYGLTQGGGGGGMSSLGSLNYQSPTIGGAPTGGYTNMGGQGYGIGGYTQGTAPVTQITE